MNANGTYSGLELGTVNGVYNGVNSGVGNGAVSNEANTNPLLLDIFPGAAAAYSLRKLRTNYNGPAIRVRRSSDNAEQDIGFDGNGNLNEVALIYFVGVSDGFVSVWYDQSLNARNCIQNTAVNQPRIAVNGVPVRNPNGKVVCNFTFQTSWLTSSTTHTFSGDITMFGMYNNAGVPSGGVFSYGEESNARRRSMYIWNEGAGATYYHYASAFAQNLRLATVTADANVLTYILFNHTSQQISGGVNGATTTTASRTLTNPAASSIHIGRTGSNEYSSGNIFELIMYNSNQSSNRTGIEQNINSYYKIY